MAYAPYLTCHNVSVSFGSQVLFKDLSFTVHPGERWGVIGPNGAGKSTLFRVLSESMMPDSGSVALRNGIRTAVVTQRFEADTTKTVSTLLREKLPIEWDLDARRKQLEQQLEAHTLLAETNPDTVHSSQWMMELSAIQDKLAALTGVGTENIIESTLRAGNLSKLADRQLSTLSGGEQKRVQIVSTLLQNPQLILLDEPTNHLDIQTVEWLEEFLLEVAEQGVGILGIRPKEGIPEPCSFVIISHDRALLDTLVNQVLEIERGEWQIYQGNYESYVQQRLENDRALQKTQERMANLYKRELAWLRAGVKARTTKQTARMERAYSLESNLREKETKLKKATAAPIEFSAALNDEERDSGDSLVPVSRPLGEQELLVLEKMSLLHPASPAKTGPGAHFLFKDLSYVLKPRMRLALLGPNGCGKSTLLKTLGGHKQPSEGSFRWHELTEVSYFDQDRHSLDKTLTVRETVCPKGEFVFFGGKYLHIMAYLDRFLFQKYDADRHVGELSGGEQARLLIAKLMLEHANLLLLDEPTNDLDITTLQTLERSLVTFPGAIVFTSHDRYFLQRVATHILVWTGTKTLNGETQNIWIPAADLDQALAIVESSQTDEAERRKEEVASRKPTQEPAKKKLTWTEKKELDALEKAIPAKEEEVTAAENELTNAYAAGRSFAETSALTSTLQQKKEALEKMYVRWEELFSKSS